MLVMEETLYARPGRLHYFVREVFKRLRIPPKDATKIADMMVAADLAGVESEGVARLPFHAERLSAGLVNPTPNIKVVHQSIAAATIDGDNGSGPVVATAAMELALNKANKHGVALIAVRSSNDFGMAGYYARKALEQHMIGIAMSNGAPTVVPVGGQVAMLGTNPLAVAIPAAENKSPFVLDMSTSVVSRSKVAAAQRKKESIPEGWALDSQGRPTTDPRVALEALRFLPLGSRPETAAHKGFGLGLAIDILCGVLSGGNFGQELSGAEGPRPGVAKNGHVLAAIKIGAYGPWVQFRNRIDVLLRKITSSKGSKDSPSVYYPGEPEFEMEQERRATGIPIPPDGSTRLQGLAKGLDLRDAWEHLLEGRK